MGRWYLTTRSAPMIKQRPAGARYNPNGSVITDANGVNADFSGVAKTILALDVNAASVTNVTSSLLSR